MEAKGLRELQQDREMGNFTYQEYDERVAQLRAMGAKNWEQAPLPKSPCIRVKATGEIHAWAQFFADRPDLCECCDENGNTDPAAWRGRNTESAGMSAENAPGIMRKVSVEPEKPVSVDAPAVPAPSGLHFDMDEFSPNVLPGEVPPVHMASIELGVPSSFATDYTDGSARAGAMPLKSHSVPVMDAVQQFFAQQHRA